MELWSPLYCIWLLTRGLRIPIKSRSGSLSKTRRLWHASTQKKGQDKRIGAHLFNLDDPANFCEWRHRSEISPLVHKITGPVIQRRTNSSSINSLKRDRTYADCSSSFSFYDLKLCCLPNGHVRMQTSAIKSTTQELLLLGARLTVAQSMHALWRLDCASYIGASPVVGSTRLRFWAYGSKLADLPSTSFWLAMALPSFKSTAFVHLPDTGSVP